MEASMLKYLLVAVAVTVVLTFAGYHFWNKHKSQDPDVFVKINAVWAVQGPFKNGAASAQAMRYATEAVGGSDSFYDLIDKHAAAYDSHPVRWEQIRKGSLEFAKGQEFETCLESAKKLGAVVNPNYASSPAH
jgi:hypothetical protein